MSEPIVSLTAILRQRLSDPDGPKNPEDIKTIADGFVEKVLLLAAGTKDKPGERWAIQEIWDRIDGPIVRDSNEQNNKTS